MEVFSTLPRTLLPWTTNVLTVGVLVAATWWSADHRPLNAAAGDFKLASAAEQAAQPIQSNDRAKPSAAEGRSTEVSARWPAAGLTPQTVRAVVFHRDQKP